MEYYYRDICKKEVRRIYDKNGRSFEGYDFEGTVWLLDVYEDTFETWVIIKDIRTFNQCEKFRMREYIK